MNSPASSSSHTLHGSAARTPPHTPSSTFSARGMSDFSTPGSATSSAAPPSSTWKCAVEVGSRGSTACPTSPVCLPPGAKIGFLTPTHAHSTAPVSLPSKLAQKRVALVELDGPFRNRRAKLRDLGLLAVYLGVLALLFSAPALWRFYGK